MLQSAGGTDDRPIDAGWDGLSGATWPDVVLADLAMPRDDGYTLIREARALADASGR